MILSFLANLCDSITDDSRRMGASRPVVIEQNQMPIIKLPGSSTIYYAQNQGFRNVAKKVGSMNYLIC